MDVERTVNQLGDTCGLVVSVSRVKKCPKDQSFDAHYISVSCVFLTEIDFVTRAGK